MGFSMSWAAVRGGTPQAVLEALALRGTGAREEIPESDTTGVELPGGWYMVASNHDDLRLTEDAALERHSRDSEGRFRGSCQHKRHTRESALVEEVGWNMIQPAYLLVPFRAFLWPSSSSIPSLA